MSRDHAVDTIRLNQREIEAMLGATDRPTSSTPDSLRRRMRRWSLNGRRVVLTLSGELGSQRNFVSAARNLSSSGMSLIHGGFIHPGTRCVISLRATDGGIVSAPATIIRCRHMQKHLHDLGIRFDQPIDPRKVIDFGEDSVFLRERVDMATLKGKVLVVDDSRSYQKLLAAYFKGSKLEVTFVNDADAGLQSLGEFPSLVFVDHQLPGMSGLEMITRARASGYEAPMVLITADTTPGLRDAALEAGATEVIIKPCPPEVIRQAAAEYLVDPRSEHATGGDAGGTAEPVAITAEMAQEYADTLRADADSMADAIEKANIELLKDLARRVKASAEGFGYPEATIAANTALKSLNATMSIEESMIELQRMISTCHRVAMMPREFPAREPPPEPTA